MRHKDYYDDNYIADLSSRLSAVTADFNAEAFTADLREQLDDKELFARFDCIAGAMEKNLGSDYAANIRSLYGLLGPELSHAEGMFSCGWRLWPVGRYVERNGNEGWRLKESGFDCPGLKN